MTRRGEKTNDVYDTKHQKLRAALTPEVEAGLWDCWRCGQRIEPGEAWDLGHNDERTAIMGPEHRHQRPGCIGNRSAGWAKLSKRVQGHIRSIRPTYGPRPDWDDDDDQPSRLPWLCRPGLSKQMALDLCQCGNMFVPVSKNHKRCGSCKDTKRIELIECVECGKTFVPRRYGAMTCGEECRRSRHRRRMQELAAPEVEIECEVCGTPFTTGRSSRKACGTECSRRREKRRKRRRWKQRKRAHRRGDHSMCHPDWCDYARMPIGAPG